MKSLQSRVQALKNTIEKELTLVMKKNNSAFKEFISYELLQSGKRVRPILTFLSSSMCGGKLENTLGVATAIELLHLFTLVHDDIMDNASFRRGRETLHEKWDVGTAILTGDLLLSFAYNIFSKTNFKNNIAYVTVFTKGFSDVCEGQALDKQFEARLDISLQEYISMIEKKTGALCATAAMLGGISSHCTKRKLRALELFGKNIGIAFQIQDDYLDNFGDEKTFGKKIGGDILEGKRTFFLVRSLEINPRDEMILRLASRKISSSQISAVIKKFRDMNLHTEASNLVKQYTDEALNELDVFPSSHEKQLLVNFSRHLIARSS
ncbi:MAG: polyprenyl synthetase family protein [Ignavibacteria bacterium]|nr:polyprenyl synthetase family protein [Ignavibacteria bacterium]